MDCLFYIFCQKQQIQEVGTWHAGAVQYQDKAHIFRKIDSESLRIDPCHPTAQSNRHLLASRHAANALMVFVRMSLAVGDHR